MLAVVVGARRRERATQLRATLVVLLHDHPFVCGSCSTADRAGQASHIGWPYADGAAYAERRWLTGCDPATDCSNADAVLIGGALQRQTWSLG